MTACNLYLCCKTKTEVEDEKMVSKAKEGAPKVNNDEIRPFGIRMSKPM